MLNRTSQDARQCRRCKQAHPAVRFAPLSQRLCLSCRDIQRAESAKRLEAARATAEALVASIPAAKPRPGTSTAHLAWVRKHPCACHRIVRCEGVIHAHHVRAGTGGGIGMKPDDRWAVPLCAAHHSELHTGGHATFEARYRLDLRAVAADLARFSPHLERPTL